MSNRHRHRGWGYKRWKIDPIEKSSRDLRCENVNLLLVIEVGEDDMWLVRQLEAHICQHTIINPVYGNVP